MNARAAARAARNVLARQTLAGASVGVAVSADDELVRVLALLVLIVNGVVDFVIELRTRQAPPSTPPPPPPSSST